MDRSSRTDTVPYKQKANCEGGYEMTLDSRKLLSYLYNLTSLKVLVSKIRLFNHAPII